MKKVKNIFLLFAFVIGINPIITLANDDLDKFLSKEDSEAFNYAWSLPKNRQIDLARLLLNNENGFIVYRGSQLLIKNGMEEESFSALARIIVEGKSKTDLKGRLGYDWLHSDDNTLFKRMMIGIMGSMNENYLTYQPSEQKISLSFFKRMGYNGIYDKDKIEAHLESLRNEIKGKR